MDSHLKIISINFPGLAKKLPVIVDLAHQNSPDIICLQETRTAEHHRLNIPGYKHYKAPMVTGHSLGLSTYIRTSIKHQLLATKTDEKAESMTIQISTHQGCLLITNLYQSPSSLLNKKLIRQIIRRRGQHLIIGDLNSPSQLYASKRDSANGKLLESLLDKSNLILHLPDKPTRMGNYLDIVLTLGVTADPDIKTLPATYSDHKPILCTLQARQHYLAPPPPPPAKIRWDKVQEYIIDKLEDNDLITQRHIDRAISNLTETIVEAIKKNSPKPRHAPLKLDPLPQKVHSTRLLMNRLKKYRNNSRLLLRTYMHTKRLFQKQLNDHRNKRWEKILEEDEKSPNHTQLWRRIKSLRTQNLDIPELTRPDGSKASSESQKAEALADRYAYVHNMTVHLGRQEDVLRAKNTLTTYLAENRPAPISKISEAEIKGYIKTSKIRKAPGKDCISNAALRKLPDAAISRTTEIFNACLRISYFPSQWKEASIKPIPKPGKDLKLPASHRPISLLSGLAKTFEKCINKRLLKHLEENNILNNNQFGFRRHHSTTQALTKFIDKIAQNINKRILTGACLLDASEAFPTLNHILLYEKLAKYKFPTNLIKLTMSYLTNRTFTVTVGDTTSSPRTMDNGTPQGSVLGPLLFIIYINDLQDVTSQTIVYADDTTLIQESWSPKKLPQYMQKQLTNTADYMDRNKIQINAAKTQVVVFTRRRCKPTTEMHINNTRIPYVDKAKLLGVTIDKRLRMTDHVQELKRKAAAATKVLHTFWNKKSPLTSKMKVRLYTTYIRPILTYAAPAWISKLAAHKIKSLQATQSKCLRAALGLKKASTKAIHEAAGIPLLTDHLKDLQTNFFQKTRALEEPHLQEIATTSEAALLHQGRKRRVKLAHEPING